MRRMLTSLLAALILPLLFSAPDAFASQNRMILPNPTPFEPGTDAVLVIDVSGSMKQSDPEYLCRSAALDFIRDLSIAGESRAALVTFSDTLQKVVPLTRLDLTSKENEVAKELHSLQYTTGDTDIGKAMEKAVSLLTEEESSARIRSIFLLTDGEIDLPQEADEEAAEKRSLTQALMAVEESGENDIVIHTVALDLSGKMDKKLLHYMADKTGGTATDVNSAAQLEDVFQKLSKYATLKALNDARAEESESENVETEAQTETEPETESETESPPVPAVHTIGSIDGPVLLSGLLPNLCTAEVKLSDLFLLDAASAGYPNTLKYTAYAEDNSLVTCKVEGDRLLLSGLKNGISRIHVIAQPSRAGAFSDASSGILPDNSSGFSSSSYEADDPDQAALSFSVQIQAVIPSVYYLVFAAAGGILLIVLFLFLRNAPQKTAQLSGSLQWYVRGENEKIFGMPAQAMADLGEYGSKVRLSELVQDDLLYGANLEKVIITPLDDGIRIVSRTSSCMIALPGAQPQRHLEMIQSGRFRVYCESDSGRAAVMLSYTSEMTGMSQPYGMEEEEERTRLLI